VALVRALAISCVSVLLAAFVACKGSTGATGGAVAMSSSTSSAAASSGAGGDASALACATCLDGKCSTEKAACDSECLAIQACIDAVCFNLSATSSPDEGKCQAYCQGMHPTGKANHLAYVDCAHNETPSPEAGVGCIPPCVGAPKDYEECVAQASAASCKPQADACAGSSDCQAYEACASGCATFAECQACAQTTSGTAGEPIFVTLQLCVAHHCLAEEWLPHF
jgi:hypothetical protein